MKEVNILDWWKSFLVLKGLYFVIEKLMTAKAISAGVERMFTTLGIVHSKILNQLGVEKAALACIFVQIFE